MPMFYGIEAVFFPKINIPRLLNIWRKNSRSKIVQVLFFL